jgi:hypothetical protein
MFFFGDNYELLILQTTSLYCVLCLIDAHNGEIKPMFGRNSMEKKCLYIFSAFLLAIWKVCFNGVVLPNSLTLSQYENLTVLKKFEFRSGGKE